MILHRNARTCPQSRRLLVERVLEQGWSLAAAAEAAGVSVRVGGLVATAARASKDCSIARRLPGASLTARRPSESR